MPNYSEMPPFQQGERLSAARMNDIRDRLPTRNIIPGGYSVDGVSTPIEQQQSRMTPRYCKILSGWVSGQYGMHEVVDVCESGGSGASGYSVPQASNYNSLSSNPYLVREINGHIAQSGDYIIAQPFMKNNGKLEYYFERQGLCEIDLSGVLSGISSGSSSGYEDKTIDLSDSGLSGKSGFWIVKGHMYEDESGNWNPVIAMSGIDGGGTTGDLVQIVKDVRVEATGSGLLDDTYDWRGRVVRILPLIVYDYSLVDDGYGGYTRHQQEWDPMDSVEWSYGGVGADWDSVDPGDEDRYPIGPWINGDIIATAEICEDTGELNFIINAFGSDDATIRVWVFASPVKPDGAGYDLTID